MLYQLAVRGPTKYMTCVCLFVLSNLDQHLAESKDS